MIKKFFTDMLPADTSYKLIWTLEDKRSHWFQNTKTLIKFVEKSKGNTFFGTGVTDLKLPFNKRATAQEITSINGFHLDIDILHTIAHKSTKLPATTEEAIKIAHGFLEPTYIINSGHGLQPYYLFNNTQKIDNFDFWTLFLQSWQRAHAAKFPDYTLDATHDLSRVLRCPGTMNCKDPENPVLCEIIEYNESAYYEKEEIEDAISFDIKDALTKQMYSIRKERESSGDKIKIPRSRRLTIVESKEYLRINNLTIEEDGAIPTDLFLNLQSMEPEFVKEFTNQTDRDSASEYQMRITNIAVKNGLSDQDVLNLMVQHRRRNGHNIEIVRIDKYVNDLLKAKKIYQIEATTEKETGTLSSDELEDIRGYIRSRTNVYIQHIWRYKKDPNMYFEVELAEPPGKIVHLGSMADGIVNQHLFGTKVMARTLKTVQKVSKNIWYNDIVKKMLKLVKDGNAPVTSTYEGQVNVWTREYFIDREIEKDIDAFLDSGVLSVPFFHKDRVYFSFETLSQWVKTTKGNNVDTFHFGIAMTKNGFIQDSIKTRTGGRIQMWGTPFGYVEEFKQ